MNIVLPYRPGPIGAIQPTDPGPIGAGMVWIDTSDTPATFFYRNAANTAWEPIQTATTTFIFAQLTPAATWTIDHYLGAYPAVTVVDSSGNVVVGDVKYVSDNEVEVTFSAAFAGSAYLN